ncbi:MAG: anion transporter [Anaerolineaceae bacterium]|nr:anion transporter [Anaerolineaceae bacterium]
MTTMQIAVGIIVLITYVGIAIGQVPGLRMNRATIALAGAAALIAVGAIDEKRAFAAIDIGTILLLAAMMVINANLRMARFFRLVGDRAMRLARTPKTLLALVILSSGVLSAVFLNDTICLMFTPLVVELTQRMKRDPIPYLIGLATAANVGSTATITGNPQNLIIGQSSGISYITFLAYLAPVALIGLGICWGVILLAYPGEFRGLLPEVETSRVEPYYPLFRRTMLIVSGLTLAFLLGAPIVSSACVAAGLLLVSRLRPNKLLALDWELLAMFGGLFVVTGAIEIIGLSDMLFEATATLLHGGVATLSITIGVLSNLVSNVPAVLLLRPEIAAFPNAHQGWLTLAMASTLAGNLTLLGSAATLIVAELARTHGVSLSFRAYLRAGIPITILTMLTGILWLSLIPD